MKILSVIVVSGVEGLGGAGGGEGLDGEGGDGEFGVVIASFFPSVSLSSAATEGKVRETADAEDDKRRRDRRLMTDSILLLLLVSFCWAAEIPKKILVFDFVLVWRR